VGDVSDSERETRAERDDSAQVIAEKGLETRKAEAIALGLGSLTRG